MSDIESLVSLTLADLADREGEGYGSRRREPSMYAFGSMYPGNEALTCKAMCCGRIEKPLSEHIQSGLEDRDSKKTEYCITKRQEDHTGNSGEDLRQHASQPAYVTVSGHAVTLHVCWPL